jgi:sigma-B regulation protein RsbU (phosphoserine phosphatase)
VDGFRKYPETGARVLLLDAAPATTRVLDERLRRRGFTPQALTFPPSNAPLPPTDLVVLVLDPTLTTAQADAIRALLERLGSANLATIVWGAPGRLEPHHGPLVEWLRPDVTLDELVGKIGTLTNVVPLVKGLERELDTLHRLGDQLNKHFGEIDQELRLAGRLQRDFLPRHMPEAPPYHFAVLYRPATWVSGDMYDVFRIDEHHLGMFVADAMGHGVAAGLLTMFLRQALVAKQVDGDSYAIVRPAEALENLHKCLVRQDLPNCQFVTAAYAIIDTRNGHVRLARAGHPYALHVRAGGAVREVVHSGSLLGLADMPAEFEEATLTLAPGDKLIFYTDGMEDAVVVPRTDGADQTVFTDDLKSWALLSAADMVTAVNGQLDCAAGSLNPADDITLLVLEVAAPSG